MRRSWVSRSRLPTSPIGSDLSDGTAAASQLIIRSQEGDAFDQRLRDEQAIEWIFVDRRKSVDVHRVLARDRQFEVAVVEESAPEHAWLDAKVIAPQTAFDGDLPHAD